MQEIFQPLWLSWCLILLKSVEVLAACRSSPRWQPGQWMALAKSRPGLRGLQPRLSRVGALGDSGEEIILPLVILPLVSFAVTNLNVEMSHL